MTILEQIAKLEQIANMGECLRVYRARTKLINLQRFRSVLEEFTDMEISNMFNIPVSKRTNALYTLGCLIAEQENHIKWLSMRKNKLSTTPEQDASIEKMYESQRNDAEALGMLPYTND